MLRVDREHEPVEEAAALAGRAAEEPVELGREPDEAQIFGEGGGRAGRRAVDAAEARAVARRARRLEAGAEPVLAITALDRGRDREAAGAAVASHLGKLGPAQAAARREERERFEKIGLADAVLAGERHEPPRDRKVERRIGAEILQDQAVTRDVPERRRGERRGSRRRA